MTILPKRLISPNDDGKEPLLHDQQNGGQPGLRYKSGAIILIGYILGNILSSVLIVLCNKAVFVRGFGFPLTLNFITYVFIWLYYVALKRSGAWTPRGRLPWIESFKVAFSSAGSIGFMNLTLLTNTIGIYQICKFAIIPCILVLQKLFFKIETNWRVLLSLVIVLSGVGYSTWKGVETGNLSVAGIVFASSAVISTSVFRIWTETKQKEFKLGPVDFQAEWAGWQAAQGLVLAVVFEVFPIESDDTVLSYISAVYKDGFGGQFPGVCAFLVGSCIFGLLVNYTSFGMIGKTGPIAYMVAGHAKTVLTIAFGIVMFPKEDTRTTIIADVVGCGLAMLGVLAYGHFEYCLKQGKVDVVERILPSLCESRECAV